MGDVDGAQKMIKMYDGLMKSGKFTAAQNKANEDGYLNSISELVLMCEKEGFKEPAEPEPTRFLADTTYFDERDDSKDEDIEEDLSLEEIEALRDEDYLEFSDFVDAEHEDDLDFVEDGDK